MNPAPGTGVHYDPNEEVIKEPQRISPTTHAAGIMQPEGGVNRKGTLVRQISVDEAEADLEEVGVDDWVKKHYDAKDFNIQSMADVLRESTEDIYNRLHAYGYELPEGTYTT